MAQNTARNSVTAITFIVSVGFGSTQANAIAGANNTLRQNRPLLHPCMTTPPSTLRACRRSGSTSIGGVSAGGCSPRAEIGCSRKLD